MAAPQLLAETYQYDAANRLVEVNYDNGQFIHYDYDSNGNIIRTRSNQQLIFAGGFE